MPQAMKMSFMRADRSGATTAQDCPIDHTRAHAGFAGKPPRDPDLILTG